jgi:hypothetical protein
MVREREMLEGNEVIEKGAVKEGDTKKKCKNKR